jgi:pimeloyl-ACP methyl ester carboxylesterase
MNDAGFVEVPGGRLYYEVEGAGHAVLLIHGGLGSLRMWDGQVGAFAQRHRVIRYDTRGYGRSESDHVPFSNRADAAAVLAHVGATSCHLVGQSRGGIIGLDFTVERPELVDSLVLVASGAGGYEPPLPAGVEAPPWDEMEHLWKTKRWEALAELETRVWVDGWEQPPTRVDPALRARVRDWILAHHRAERDEGIPQPLDPPARDRLGEVRAPTLVMVGLADETGALLSGRYVADGIPGARLVEFPGVAHMIQVEDPERFSAEVLDFVAAAEARA